jgi:DNA polymerase III delta prime subunit
MIQHPNPLKQIIDDIKARLDMLEADMQTTKWTVTESIKIAEQNELAIDSISRILQQDPVEMRKPINKGGRPKVQSENTRKIIRKHIVKE